jgi:predicted restriction endonuclease
VSGWAGGYFILEGFTTDGQSRGGSKAVEIAPFLEVPTGKVDQTVDLQNIIDTREQILATIVCRRGQPQFRQTLLEAYGRRCAITDCDAIQALEAAHIIPYFGPGSDHPTNGLLLRADIHTLFDLGLIAIETHSMGVLLSPSLGATTYNALVGAKLRLPEDESCFPSRTALDQHRLWSGL